MNKFLIGLVVIAALGMAWLGYSAADYKSKLHLEQLAREQAQREREALLDALVEVQRSTEREQARLDRAIRNIQGIRNEPVTTGCGPAVHGAIDRLRD